MAQATFVHNGAAVDYTPSADVAIGDVVVQGELVGVAVRAIPANTLGTLAVEGVFDFAKATGTGTAITAGANVYWDDTNKVATTSATGNKLLGKAVQAAADADTQVRVRLTQQDHAVADLLARGAAWLADQRRKHLSRMVTYVRGLDRVDIPATVGRSTFEQVDEHGVLQRTEADDFLISPADLVLDGKQVLPEAGDQIRESTEGGRTRVCEVLAIGTEPPWRWSDPHRTTLRIHSKLIGTEDKP